MNLTPSAQHCDAHKAEQPFWSHEASLIPLCQLLVQRYPELLLELTELTLALKPFKKFPDYGLYSSGWEAFPLSIYEGEFNDHVPELSQMDMSGLAKQIRPFVPLLSELITPLEDAGQLRNVFVSRLKPGSYIRPHRGWTSNYLRIHLGLLCDPACRITVGNETQSWLPGQLLAFKDGGPYLHSVRHDGSRDRIVISLDLRLKYVQSFIPQIQGDHLGLS